MIVKIISLLLSLITP